MSTTGDRSVGSPPRPAPRRPVRAGRATTATRRCSARVDTYRVIGSPGFAFDEAALRERGRAVLRPRPRPGRRGPPARRGPDAPTTARGAWADHACPPLVVHGAQDTLVDVSGGRATAAAIPGAELLGGRGHGPRPAARAVGATSSTGSPPSWRAARPPGTVSLGSGRPTTEETDEFGDRHLDLARRCPCREVEDAQHQLHRVVGGLGHPPDDLPVDAEDQRSRRPVDGVGVVGADVDRSAARR